MDEGYLLFASQDPNRQVPRSYNLTIMEPVKRVVIAPRHPLTLIELRT